MTAPVESGEQGDSSNETNTAVITVVDPEIHVFDLYAVGHDPEHAVQPFIHRLGIEAVNGQAIEVQANFDDGALANAMSITKFNSIKQYLKHYKESQRWLRMADGSLVKPLAMWEGEMEIGGIRVHGSFEVFDSGGNWDFLLGKPLLTALHVVHEYTHDTVTISEGGRTAVLKNQVNGAGKECPAENLDMEKQETLWGSGDVLPSREVHEKQHNNEKIVVNIAYTETTEPSGNPNGNNDGAQELDNNDKGSGTEIEVDTLEFKSNLFTRFTDPRKKERVAEILRQVTVGPDLNEEERNKVTSFLTEWADVFALSVSEVKQVDGAVLHLDIPSEAKFSTKVNQKPLMPPQRKYLHESIDKMLEAGIIEQCLPDQVKCASPTTLAQKAHTGTGLVLEELQHRVNDECITHGYNQFFNLPPRSSPTPDDESSKTEPKWRICQNFSQVNKVTKIAPMPQGDIRAKQQRLSGHRWVSGFDFAAGFYAVTIDEESR